MNITVISGPPCSGKTYLINQLKENNALPEIIGGWSHNDYILANANLLRKTTHINMKNLLLHYDCFRFFKRGLTPSIDNDPALKKIISSNKTIFIHLSNNSSILAERASLRLQRIEQNITNERIAKIKRLIILYKNPENYKEEYKKWLDFVLKTFNANHFQILGNKNNIEQFDYNAFMASL